MLKDLDALKVGEISSDGSFLLTERTVSTLAEDTNGICSGYPSRKMGFHMTPVVHEGVEVTNDSLSLCGKEVIDYAGYCTDYPNLGGNIPSLYCIRRHDGNTYRFVTGFDLFPDGSVWHGYVNELVDLRMVRSEATKFDDLKSAISHLYKLLGDEWVITLEEPMYL